MSRGTGGTREIRARAPAKVNLGLEVLGRREDGYHELATTILALDLYDEVTVRLDDETGGTELVVDGPHGGPDVPGDSRNLAWRAAEAVRERANETRRLHLRLTKHIPPAAGLGGGSADAAAALLATSAAIGLAGDEARDVEMLSHLGSDCPFFLVARTGLARCAGRGDVVRPVAGEDFPWWIVVVAPAVECSTAEVYGAFEAHSLPAPEPSFDLDAVLHGALDDARSSLVNDLEAAALASHAGLAAWPEVFDHPDAGHLRLAGSGSSFFGLYGNEADAKEALAGIVARAKARDLGLRGSWVLRAAGGGAAVVDPTVPTV